jgi:oxygen-independent coproporphyrinogen-3 oxidase
MGEKPLIREIHIGGGTPTFFSVQNLEDLINGILSHARVAADHVFSFEGHPNNTTRAHLQKFYDLGFRRVSYGVQDYADTVQQAIHRVQSFHDVAKVTFWAKEIGYTSIGHDLIFGLPFQTIDDVIDTIEKTNALRPDRLAFYSYAHVPWLKPGQRKFTEADLPAGNVKRQLYEQGRAALENAGYIEIGMDHFALPNDPLNIAEKNKTLHRNFMGYTTSKSKLLIQ